jgi:putative ABC transport system permease protein
VYIANSVTSMGADGFRIVRMAFIGNFSPKRFLELQKKNPQLSPEEFEYLRDKVTMLREFGMGCSRSANVTFGSQTLSNIELDGGTANWAALTNTQIAMGRYLTEIETSHHAPVAVLGSDIRDRLFGDGANPVGKTIKVDGRPFTVIGVAMPNGSVFGQSQDNFVHIPVGMYFQIYGSRQGIVYAAAALSPAVMEQAQDEITMLLRARRHLRPGGDDTFSIVSSDAIVSAWDRLTGAIAATAIAVVSVFMVVGGVVIMNIMLAVVSERTREIGIRKSVGARRQDILNQFLVESSMLAGTGGLIGVILAWSVAILIRNVTPVPMSVPPSAVIIGVGLSMAVGLFFGIYPAQRASKLDPIEALRAEA